MPLTATAIESADRKVAGSDVTELLVVGGDRYCVTGGLDEVEAKILEAARGSILELVWLIEAGSGDSLALNPAHIVALRNAKSPEPPPGGTG